MSDDKSQRDRHLAPYTREQLAEALERSLPEEQKIERARRAEELRVESSPLLVDLESVGVSVSSIDDLIGKIGSHPEALPVLADHLGRDYAPIIRAGIARALAVKAGAFAWPKLVAEYRTEIEVAPQQQLAVALNVTATAENLDELISLIGDPALPARSLLLSALKRLGGQRGFEMLEQLRDDPQLGVEATKLTRSRRKGSGSALSGG